MGQENHCVYMHVAPNGKKYVGITCQKPEARWGKDGSHYKVCPRMCNAIKKYGWDNFHHIVLYKGLSCEEAGTLEKRLIARYQTTDIRNGYNICVGGEVGALGVKRSEETKKKMGLAQKGHTRLVGYKHSEQAKKNMSMAQIGNKHALGIKKSEETKKKMSDAQKGKPRKRGYKLSEQTKAKLSAAQIGNKKALGKKRSAETRALMSANNGRSRPVNQYSLDGVFIKNYVSLASAGRSVNKSKSTIGDCCRGKNKTAAGFMWRYEKEAGEIWGI